MNTFLKPQSLTRKDNAGQQAKKLTNTTNAQTKVKNAQAFNNTSYVDLDLDNTMCGLQHWYKHLAGCIGTLSSMSDTHPNRPMVVTHIDESLEHLNKAIEHRITHLGGVSDEQFFDLKVMKKHVTQMKESVKRLNA